MKKNTLRQLFPSAFVLSRGIKLLFSSRSHLVQSGYVESIRRKQPCRADGSPLPWMNSSVISFLDQRLSPSLTLFEYGSGFSTAYYASKVKHVTSIEHDQSWFEHGQKARPDNVNLIHISLDNPEAYCRAIENVGNHYDIVVVDGRERERCLQASLNSITPEGVIILDDSQRDRYQAVREEVLAGGFRCLDFTGLKPGGISEHQTTIFYRDGNCLGI